MFELFFNEKTIKGSYYGSADVRSDFKRLLRLWKAGKLDLDGMITPEDRPRRCQRGHPADEARRGHPHRHRALSQSEALPNLV